MRFAVYTILVALVALSGLVALQFKNLDSLRHDSRRQTCSKIASLDNTLIGLIREGEKTLPTLSYYKTHPSELAASVKADEAAVRALTPPAYC